MQTPFVFKLSSLALIGLSLGSIAGAQDAEIAPDAPRLRVGQMQLPHGVVSATPSLGMLRRAETPRLGVMVEASADGIQVNEVQEDSLASAAGVKAGDLLLSLDGQRLGEISDIGTLLAAVEPGSEFQLSVVRAGEGLVKLQGKRPALEVKEQAKVDGHSGAFLGVTLGAAADGGGVSVSEVYDNTAAWFAGLESGDVLTSVGDSAVNSADEVASAVAGKQPGSSVALSWIRGDAKHTTHVRLGHRNAQPQLFGNQSFPGFVIPQGNARGGSFNLRFPGGEGHDGQIFRWNNNGQPHHLELKELHENLGDLHEHLETLKTHPNALRFHLKGDGDADGNVWFSEQDGDGDGEHNVFFSKSGDGPHLITKGMFGKTGDGPQMIDVHKILKDAGIDLDELQSGAKKLQIKIDGDKVEVITDGEVQVHELDASAALDPASNVLYSFSTNAEFPTGLTRTIAISSGTECAAAVECEAACEVEVECEGASACKVEMECEGEAECELEMDCEAETECELDEALEEVAVEASDDDLL